MIRPMFQYIKDLDLRNLVGVEVGVKRGVNAYNILCNLNVEKLYLVDPYLPYRDWNGFIQFSGLLDVFAARWKLRGFKDSVGFVYKSSEVAVDGFRDGSLDFVYIDGNHCYESVYRDMCLWYRKVRSGGVFGGHDFDYVHNGVMVAVLDFVDSNDLEFFDIVDGDWWLIK